MEDNHRIRNMHLAKVLASGYLLNSEAKDGLFKFKDREKCIKSVFWTAFHNLEAGKKTLLVVEDKTDLENLNYLLSRQGVKELCLIISDSDKINTQYMLTKQVEAEKLKPRMSQKLASHQEATTELELTLAELKDALHRLRVPQIGSMSISEINDKLEFTESRRVDFDQSILGPPYTYENYKSKKALYERIQSLYRMEFHFLSNQDPFIKTQSEVVSSRMGIALKDYLEEAYQLKDKIETIEKQVLRSHSSENHDKIEDIKKRVFQIRSMMADNKQLTETQITKLLFHQKEVHELLRMEGDPPLSGSELLEGLDRINQAVEEKLQSEYITIQSQADEFLEKLTAHSEVFQNVPALINGVNALRIKLKNLSILEDIPLSKGVGLLQQKKALQELIDKVEYARFFFESNPDYFEWKEIEFKLTKEDHVIIKYLASQNSFWGDAFEELFLEYYRRHMLPTLDSPNQHFSQLDYLVKCYAESYPYLLMKPYLDQPDLELEDTSDKRWSDLLEESGLNLLNKYPIVIVDTAFYEKNIDKVAAHLDSVVFLNSFPKTVKSEEWLSCTLAGYDPLFIQKSSVFAEKNSELSVHQIDETSYTINRAFSSMNLSEVHKAAKYLGQEIQRVNARHRLYQLKNLSIISFLADTKNVQVVNELESEGIKEIISNATGANLIPGLFSEVSAQVMLLIEDNMLSVDADVNIVAQQQLLSEIKTAGIKVLNLDNLSMIMHGSESFKKVIQKTKSANRKQEELALA